MRFKKYSDALYKTNRQKINKKRLEGSKARRGKGQNKQKNIPLKAPTESVRNSQVTSEIEIILSEGQEGNGLYYQYVINPGRREMRAELGFGKQYRLDWFNGHVDLGLAGEIDGSLALSAEAGVKGQIKVTPTSGEALIQIGAGLKGPSIDYTYKAPTIRIMGLKLDLNAIVRFGLSAGVTGELGGKYDLQNPSLRAVSRLTYNNTGGGLEVNFGLDEELFKGLAPAWQKICDEELFKGLAPASQKICNEDPFFVSICDKMKRGEWITPEDSDYYNFVLETIVPAAYWGYGALETPLEQPKLNPPSSLLTDNNNHSLPVFLGTSNIIQNPLPDDIYTPGVQGNSSEKPNSRRFGLPNFLKPVERQNVLPSLPTFSFSANLTRAKPLFDTSFNKSSILDSEISRSETNFSDDSPHQIPPDNKLQLEAQENNGLRTSPLLNSPEPSASDQASTPAPNALKVENLEVPKVTPNPEPSKGVGTITPYIKFIPNGIEGGVCSTNNALNMNISLGFRVHDLDHIIIDRIRRLFKPQTIKTGSFSLGGEVYHWKMVSIGGPTHWYDFKTVVKNARTGEKSKKYSKLKWIEFNDPGNIPCYEKSFNEAFSRLLEKSYPNFLKDQAKLNDEFKSMLQSHGFIQAKQLIDNFQAKYPFDDVIDFANKMRLHVDEVQSNHLVDRAIIERNGNKTADAMLTLARARELCPANIRISIELANCYLKDNNLPSAIEELKKFEHLHPNYKAQRSLLEQQYAKQNEELKLAKEREASALNLQSPKAEENHCPDKDIPDRKDSIAEIVSALEATTEAIQKANELFEQAIQFEAEGKEAEAIIAYEHVLKLDPRHRAAFNLALIHESNGDFLKAKEVLDGLPETLELNQHKAELDVRHIDSYVSPFINVGFQIIHEIIQRKNLPFGLNAMLRGMSGLHYVHPKIFIRISYLLAGDQRMLQSWRAILREHSSNPLVTLQGLYSAAGMWGLAPHIPCYQYTVDGLGYFQNAMVIRQLINDLNLLSGLRFNKAIKNGSLALGIALFTPTLLSIYDRIFHSTLRPETMQECIRRELVSLAVNLACDFFGPSRGMHYRVFADLLSLLKLPITLPENKRKWLIENARDFLSSDSPGAIEQASLRYEQVRGYQEEIRFYHAVPKFSEDLSHFIFSAQGGNNTVAVHIAASLITKAVSSEAYQAASLVQRNHLLDTLQRLTQVSVKEAENPMLIPSINLYASIVAQLAYMNSAAAQSKNAAIYANNAYLQALANRTLLCAMREWLIGDWYKLIDIHQNAKEQAAEIFKSHWLAPTAWAKWMYHAAVENFLQNDTQPLQNQKINLEQQALEYKTNAAAFSSGRDEYFGHHFFKLRLCKQQSATKELEEEFEVINVLDYLYAEKNNGNVITDLQTLLTRLLAIRANTSQEKLRQLANMLLRNYKSTESTETEILPKLHAESIDSIDQSEVDLSSILASVPEDPLIEESDITKPVLLMQCFNNLISQKLSASNHSLLSALFADFMEPVPYNIPALNEDPISHRQFRYEQDMTQSSHSLLSLYLSAMLMFAYLIQILTQEGERNKRIWELRYEILDGILLRRYAPPFSILLVRLASHYAVTEEQAHELLRLYDINLDQQAANAKLDLLLLLFKNAQIVKQKPSRSLGELCRIWGETLRASLFPEVSTKVIYFEHFVYDRKEVEEELKNGANPNLMFIEKRETSAYDADSYEHIKLIDYAIFYWPLPWLVELLCQYGLDLDSENKSLTPLMLASITLIQSHDAEKSMRLRTIINHLVYYGSDLHKEIKFSFFSNPYTWLDYGGSTPAGILSRYLPEFKLTHCQAARFERSSFIRATANLDIHPMLTHEQKGDASVQVPLDKSKTANSNVALKGPDPRNNLAFLHFQRISNAGGGNCALLSLGIEREELVEKLLSLRADENARRILSEEIYEAIRDPGLLEYFNGLQDLLDMRRASEEDVDTLRRTYRDFIPDDLPREGDNTQGRILYNWLRENNYVDAATYLELLVDRAKTAQIQVKDFLKKEENYAQYVNILSRDRVWVGYASVCLYARAKGNIDLRIWVPQAGYETELNLIIHQVYRNVQSQIQLIDILYNPRIGHFERLCRVGSPSLVPIQEKKPKQFNNLQVAIGLHQEQLLHDQLQDNEDAYRQLLAQEIKTVFTLFIAIDRVMKDRNEENLNALSNLRQGFLPENLFSTKVQKLVTDYSTARDAIRSALANNLLLYPQFKRLTFSKVREFFSSEKNCTDNKAAFDIFTKALNNFLPHEKALNDYCQSTEAQEAYCGLFAKNQVDSFIPHKQRISIVDSFARYLNEQIIIFHQGKENKVEEVYRTKSCAQKTIYLYDDGDHFFAMKRNFAYFRSLEPIILSAFGFFKPSVTFPTEIKKVAELVMDYCI